MTIEQIKSFVKSKDVYNIMVVLHFHVNKDGYTTVYYACRDVDETEEMVLEDINRVNERGYGIGNQNRIKIVDINTTRILKYDREEKIKSIYDIR